MAVPQYLPPAVIARAQARGNLLIRRSDTECAEDTHNPLAPRIYEGGCPRAAQDRGEYAV